MVFWIIICALALAVSAILLRGAARGVAASDPAASYDLKVYRDQMAEVERDLARGIVNPEDAERTRTEIARRILAADSAAQNDPGEQPMVGTSGYVWGIAILALLVVGSVALYMRLGVAGYGDLALKDRITAAEQFRANRPSQADAEAGLSPEDLLPPLRSGDDYESLVTQLRTVVADRPNDIQGLLLLSVSERNLGNYTAAHTALSRYIDLRGEETTSAEFAQLADLLIHAAGGYVSPEAEAAAALALQADPTNGTARYFQGLMLAQTGRPDQAFQIWDRQLRIGPAEARWIPPIQAQIDEMAARAGVNYVQPSPGGGRGPSSADIEAAGDLSASERIAMIEGMVSGLAERLSSEGGTVQDWARLITSLGVLGRTNDAFSVYQNAVQVFAEDPSAMDIINRAGDQAGVAN